MSDVRAQLQRTLGDSYTLERELGGGGMSQVFVAEERALGRKVVVKVLPPELSAGLNVDRFRREIQLAAKLQHPHIVPVLTTGEMNGLPYYTMPFVEGESLRARLGRGVPPVSEAIGVLRDVARALAFAHRQGVVHRDIKPENVLLSEGSATVADFGIAKALSASKMVEPGETLTQVGTSLGTPPYMSPEQVAGDPNADHRADLYAFGCVAYEVLTGHPPFQASSPQKLLAMHLSEFPRPLQELRPDLPPALAAMVMQCLEKDAAHRPDSASAIVAVLDGATSTSDGAPAPGILMGGPGMWKKALGVYAAVFIGVIVLAKAAIVGIGLPDWVFPGAVIVMALGLPVILATAYVHRVTHRAFVSTPTRTPGGSVAPQGTMATIALKASPHLSWRRTALGGVYAIGGFVFLIAAWMVMRALGVGPAASLMTAGKMGERERIIVADFGGPPTDSLLGLTVTEAFRTDLGQSQNLFVMPDNSVREVMRRMQRDPNTHVDFALAREIATREGIKAVVDGDIVALGGSYVLSARLVAAQTGEQLAAFRETADEAKDIIPAISRLTKQLRSRVGESLRSVQQARTLDKVSTPSLEALQKYVAGVRAMETEGDFARGQSLLEEAIAIDTGFAMAYRKLSIELRNRGLQVDRADSLIEKAFAFRDRLSDTERYITLGSYYRTAKHRDADRTIAAYESLLELDSLNVTALNNLSLEYRERREFAKAEALLRRAVTAQPTAAVFFTNFVANLISQGKVAEAEQAVALAGQNLPRNPVVSNLRFNLEVQRGRYDAAKAISDSVAAARANDPVTRRQVAFARASLAQLLGQLNEAKRHQAEGRRLAVQLGNAGAALAGALDPYEWDVRYEIEPERAIREIDRILALPEYRSLPRPHSRLMAIFGEAGLLDRAREEFRKIQQLPEKDRPDSVALLEPTTILAFFETRYDDAVRGLRALDRGPCQVCVLPPLGDTYDRAGNADSAIAIFTRYADGVERPLGVDASWLAFALKRLGELHDAKGNVDEALSFYARFVELWKDADAELQPQVKKARDRLVELQRRRG